MPDTITTEIANRVTDLIQGLPNADRWWVLAQMLECHSDWNKTPEGNNYWQTVRDKMMANSKGPRVSQTVYTKEDTWVNGIIVRANTKGHIVKLEPVYVQFEGMVNLLFPIPLEKLHLR